MMRWKILVPLDLIIFKIRENTSSNTRGTETVSELSKNP